MPQKVVKFKGINRMINEFQTSGECEELINMRLNASGGLSVIKPKKIVETGTKFDKLYEHAWGEVRNLIVVNTDGNVEWIAEDGGVKTITSEFTTSNVSISSAGNVLVVYNEDDEKQYVFKFKDGEYEHYTIIPQQIEDIYVHYDSTKFTTATASTNSEFTKEGYNDAMQRAAAKFYYDNPNGLCGAAVIGCTYELEGGEEIWSTAFMVANALNFPEYQKPGMYNNDERWIQVHGASELYVNLTLGKKNTDGIKRINIYATRPVMPYESEIVKETTTGNPKPEFNKIPLEDLNLASQLMYYQGSIDLGTNQKTLLLNFGMSQGAEKVMEVTSGCINRVGQSVSYNNRFHYYNSKKTHQIQIPTASASRASENSSFWLAYVKFENDNKFAGKWKLINKIYEFDEATVQDFIYPMAGVTTLAFVKMGFDITKQELSAPYAEMFYVNLKDSPSYNYSYVFDVLPSIESAAYFGELMRSEGQRWSEDFVYDTTVDMKNETNIINVSAQYNPYVFPVEYSYSFGGEIIDIATAYTPITSTQIGQYPINVFTSAGIFAMEQGDGSVLYSNITPLQPHVIEGRAASTPHGIFFISSKNVFVLAGRDVANITYVLNGARELELRENKAHKLLCGSDGTFYKITQILSTKDFEDFVSDAILTYDQLNNELYISSKDNESTYSYVFGLNTKQFHKTSLVYLNTQSGARYTVEKSGSNRRIVDLHTEEKVDESTGAARLKPILLQTRPMSLDAAFTHIQRLILLADAKLKDGQYLCLSVFGSDNLSDWKCIISSQKQDTVLRQIRTNKSAKSYRDYVILITGLVDTDTDISDLIADYTVVNRRLG